MPTIHVERSDWRRFLDDFSRRHTSRVVTLEVLDAAIGAQISCERLPLEGLSLDEEGLAIDLCIGDRTDDHVDRSISRPTGIYVKQSDEGFDQVLEIETNSQKFLLYFE
jgi:hypothetical protein